MHESIYAAVRCWTFQSLANIDPILCYGGVALCCSETSFVSLPENITSLPEDQAQLKSCIGQEQNREGSGFQLVIKLKKIDPHTKKADTTAGYAVRAGDSGGSDSREYVWAWVNCLHA